MMRRYAEYRDSGVEWLGEVPAGWEVVPLKAVAQLIMGQSPSSNDCNEDGIGLPFLQGCAEFGDMTPSPRQFCEIAPKVVKENCILLSVRAPVGATNISDRTYGIGRGLCGIAASGATAEYLWWTVQASVDRLNSVATGSTYLAVSIQQVAALEVARPPLPEQTAIAAFLDVQTAAIDGLIEQQRRLIALLREKRQAVISHAVTRGLNPKAPLKPSGIDWLGDVPEGWEVVKLASQFRASKGPRGQLLTKEYCGANFGDYPVYSGQTENAGIMGTISDYDFDAAENGVLFSTTVGARAMTVSHLRGKFSLSQNCMIISGTSAKVFPRFFYYHFQPLFAYFRQQIPEHMQASFRMSDLYEFKIALPPIEEQEEIAAKLDEQDLHFDTLTTTAESAIALLVERRAALISAAVTGKIDVRDWAKGAAA